MLLILRKRRKRRKKKFLKEKKCSVTCDYQSILVILKSQEIEVFEIQVICARLHIFLSLEKVG